MGLKGQGEGGGISITLQSSRLWHWVGASMFYIAWVPALVRLVHTEGVAHVILPTPPSTSGGYGGDQTSTGLTNTVVYVW